MKHSEHHPQYVEGCFGCKAQSIYVSGSALPTRKRAVMETNQKDKQLAKDMAAYKRLRHDGIQPRQIDGSADAEARAHTKFEIEAGHVFTGPNIESRVKEGLTRAQELRETA